MFTYQENLRAIAAMCVAIAGFIANDALIKLASETLPLGEIIFIRGIITGIAMVAIIRFRGEMSQLHHMGERKVLLRTLAEVAASVAYLLALFKMPIANATTVMQTVPLAVAAGGALFFGHHVGWRRWTAILVGLAGVIIVIRPGVEGFDAYALLVLLSVVFVAIRDILTARLGHGVSTTMVVAGACFGLGITGLLLFPFETWLWPSGSMLAILVAASAMLLVGFFAIIVSLRIGDISVTAPFRYTAVLWATLYGFLIWDELPDWLTFVGMGLVVATGVYTLARERQLARRGLGDAEPAPAVSGGDAG
ncbi:MAG: DMT family transporter [Bauldia sp.]|nr:DMT family transporter [Bauldia sp.]